MNPILERFNNTYINNSHRQHPFNWFNSELKANLDIDLLSEPALGMEGYRIYTVKRAKVLLLKLELYQTVIDYYSLRFQIEFNFRDAKQFWGLEDFIAQL